jgi:hypothetical protein
VAINGSGFSGKVMPNGQFRLYGPDGETLHNIKVTVDYRKP